MSEMERERDVEPQGRYMRGYRERYRGVYYHRWIGKKVRCIDDMGYDRGETVVVDVNEHYIILENGWKFFRQGYPRAEPQDTGKKTRHVERIPWHLEVIE
jgi:hypothetical protein